MSPSVNAITQARCFHHPDREAVARCPECERFFCRECITEHEDRVICANCLRVMADSASRTGMRTAGIRMLLHLLLSFMLAWLVFYSAGRTLLKLPTSFHEGTIWRELAWEVP